MNLFDLATEGMPEEAPRQIDAPLPSAGAPTRGFSRPQFDAAFDAAGQEYGVDPDILRAMAYTESRFNTEAVSPKGATGVMQFMPGTAKRFGINPKDPIESIFGAAAYMRSILEKHDGDYEKAVAGYNMGESHRSYKKEDWKSAAPTETQNYIELVLGLADQLKAGQVSGALPSGVKPSQAGAGRGMVNPPTASEPAPAETAPTTNNDGLQKFADAQGVPVEVIQAGLDAAKTQTLDWAKKNPGKDPNALYQTHAAGMVDDAILKYKTDNRGFLDTIKGMKASDALAIGKGGVLGLAKGANDLLGNEYDSKLLGKSIAQNDTEYSNALRNEMSLTGKTIRSAGESLVQMGLLAPLGGLVGAGLKSAIGATRLGQAADLATTIAGKDAPLLARTVMSAPGVVASGVAEGAASATQGAGQAADEFDAALKKDPKVILESPAYQEALATTKNQADALKLLRNTAINKGAAYQGLATVLTAPLFGGGWTGDVANRMLGAAVRNTDKGLVGALKPLAREAGQEFGQSGAEAMAGDLAAKQTYDPTREVGADALTQASEGGIAGALMAGFGHANERAIDAIRAKLPVPKVENQPTTPVAPEVTTPPADQPPPPAAPTTPPAQPNNLASILKREGLIDGKQTQEPAPAPAPDAQPGVAPEAPPVQPPASDTAGPANVPANAKPTGPLSYKLTQPTSPQPYAQTNATPTPQPGDVVPTQSTAVADAKAKAAVHSDLSNETQYTDEILNRIAGHPESGPELKAAVAQEQKRRTDERVKAEAKAEASRAQALSGDSADISPNVKAGAAPLSVEHGIKLMKEGIGRPMIDSTRAYLGQLKAEIGDKAFDLIKRHATQPFRTSMTERKNDIPRLIEANNTAIAKFNQEPTNAKTGTETASPTVAPAAPNGSDFQRTTQPTSATPVVATVKYGNNLTAKASTSGSTAPATPKVAPIADTQTFLNVSSQLYTQTQTTTTLPNGQKVKNKDGLRIAPTKKKLTVAQTAASMFANALGRTLTVFDKVSGQRKGGVPNGFVDQDGGQHLFVSSESDDGPLFVAVHEVLHSLPEHIRKPLLVALNKLAKNRAGFSKEFGYSEERSFDELPAMMAQAAGKNPSFWEDLRTAMGNKDFAALAKHILSKLDAMLTGVKAEYGQAFIDKYVTDAKEMQRLLVEAYAKAMKEQGATPDTGGIQMSNKAVADETSQDRESSITSDRVSPRLPTAVKATEDPMRDDRLQPDLETAKRDQASFAHNIGLMAQYPNFKGITGSVDDQAETMINEMVDNLKWLHDHWKPELRNRSKMWYVGGNRIATRWARRFDVSPMQVAAVIAAISPQKDWFQNVSLAERILEAVINQSDKPWDSKMTKLLSDRDWGGKLSNELKFVPKNEIARFEGKTLREMYNPAEPDKSLLDMAVWVRAWDEAYNPMMARVITPEGGFANQFDAGKNGKPIGLRWQSFAAIAKTFKVLQINDPSELSQIIGSNHKVRSFYNNIIAPFAGEDVTIDTHAVAAALLRPLGSSAAEVLHNFGSGIVGEGGPKNSAVTGLYGTYAIYAEAYRRAAEQLGLLPREVQSITWEAVRGLFRPEQKNDKIKAESDRIWSSSAAGEIDGNTARQQISQLVGGIVEPAWVRSPAGSNEAARDSSYEGELPADGLPGRGSKPVARRTGGDTASGDSGPETLAFSNKATGKQQIGINVRSDTKAGLRYADLLVDGEKTYETRATDSLRPYVGRTVGIVRTGEGKAKAIGTVKIGEPIKVGESKFKLMRSQHLVPAGSAFDIEKGGEKYLYPITEAKRFDEEYDVEQGIVGRAIKGAPAFSNKSRNLDQDIVLEIPIEGGKTAKLTVNAQTYITQLDAREDALRMVKECMA